MSTEATEICPNCQIPLETFSTGKDVELSNGDREITVRRIYILACPECQYEGRIWTE